MEQTITFHEPKKGQNVSLPDLMEAIDIVEVLEDLGFENVDPTKKQYKAPCPFYWNHKNEDKSPSFGINLEKKVYNCFLCGGGSIIDLYAKVNDVSLGEAIIKLKKKYILNLGDFSLEQFKKKKEKLFKENIYEIEKAYSYNVDKFNVLFRKINQQIDILLYAYWNTLDMIYNVADLYTNKYLLVYYDQIIYNDWREPTKEKLNNLVSMYSELQRIFHHYNIKSKYNDYQINIKDKVN